MRNIYSSPLKVYIIIAVLALIGLLSGRLLPISLFPNSSRPTIGINIKYNNLTSEQFTSNYGETIEARLSSLKNGPSGLEQVTATYRKSSVEYVAKFAWGIAPREAKIDIENIVNGLSSSWPELIRNSLSIYSWNRNSGFIAVSFYSDKRNLDDLYKLVDAELKSKLLTVADAESPSLWNPNQKSLTLKIDNQKMTNLGLFPKDIIQAIQGSKISYNAGRLNLGKQKMNIQVPKAVANIEQLKYLIVKSAAGKAHYLSDIAVVSIDNSVETAKVFKTSGEKSIILFASPRNGGNVKKMADDILNIIQNSMANLPADIKYKTLVDPSSFIQQSVNNVIHEVILAGILAVLVLFIFIGSFKHTITAAIEIPLSMVLAFILMKMTNMNINLISLGGLALSAGMNVDASVVVMENIFRHFSSFGDKKLTYAEKVTTLTKAVKEVSFPIITSTISTLVVFTPLAFTSDLANAILGDLAKAVVFSHGSALFVALFLVPTIRLQVLGRKASVFTPPTSLIHKLLKFTENQYLKNMQKLLLSRYTKWILISFLLLSFIPLFTWLTPQLKKEIIGKPNTDWIIIGMNTNGNTVVKQMEDLNDQLESQLFLKFGQYINYTFAQIRAPNRSNIMIKLKDKKKMDELWKALEKEFINTPDVYYYVVPWNPAELPLPNPPDLSIKVSGGTHIDRNTYATDLFFKLKEEEVFPRLHAKSGRLKLNDEIIMQPRKLIWDKLLSGHISFSPYDIAELVRLNNKKISIGSIDLSDERLPLFLSFKRESIKNQEELESLAIKIENKLYPIKALMEFKVQKEHPRIYREDGEDLILLNGKQNKGKDHLNEAAVNKAREILADFKQFDVPKLKLKSVPIATIADPQKDLNQAISELTIAVFLSIALIFLTLLLQFGNIVQCFIIMSSVPLGILGGLTSLYVFGSTLSLNSILGIILLNGIAVNNSIILVDFILKELKQGTALLAAICHASKLRLRPILITTLTTILGMIPIALGIGEGGKVLQPLGIVVASGLMFSTICTLFLVPFLEYTYLRKSRVIKADSDGVREKDDINLIINKKEKKQPENPSWQ